MEKVKETLIIKQENDRGKADDSRRKSDKEIWDKAKSRTIGEILAQPCNTNCHCGGVCMFKVCIKILI